MASVNEHYDTLLAEHYTWMFGSFEARVAEQRALLERLGVARVGAGTAIDLGCGPGFQSVALAQLGFGVTAIDTSDKLLAELDARKGDLPIGAVKGDIRALAGLVDPGAGAVVCMGDTLTHLGSKGEAARLLADVYRVLAPGGTFALSFRDLTTELLGLDRFIPVRSDPDKVMTCFLEYEPETVVVHDLVHARDGAGWTFRKSSYRKLRLDPEWVAGELTEIGFSLRHREVIGRLWTIAAAREQPSDGQG